jgi:hypothetical protein
VHPRATSIRHGRPYAEVSLDTATAETDLAYLAGIIDGEGYFAVSDKSNTFGITVSVTDECLIDWLHKRFSGNVSKRFAKTSTHRDVHKWYLQRHADLAWLIPRVAPYLVIKRNQADAMLRFVEHVRNPPHWETPTSRASRIERHMRRDELRRWRDKRETLRMSVRFARHPDESFSVG